MDIGGINIQSMFNASENNQLLKMNDDNTDESDIQNCRASMTLTVIFSTTDIILAVTISSIVQVYRLLFITSEPSVFTHSHFVDGYDY